MQGHGRYNMHETWRYFAEIDGKKQQCHDEEYNDWFVRLEIVCLYRRKFVEHVVFGRIAERKSYNQMFDIFILYTCIFA